MDKACYSCILYGFQFVSQLLYFYSSSLIMAWERQPKRAHVLGSLPSVWKTLLKLLAPGFVPASKPRAKVSPQMKNLVTVSLWLSNK